MNKRRTNFEERRKRACYLVQQRLEKKEENVKINQTSGLENSISAANRQLRVPLIFFVSRPLTFLAFFPASRRCAKIKRHGQEAILSGLLEPSSKTRGNASSSAPPRAFSTKMERHCSRGDRPRTNGVVSGNWSKPGTRVPIKLTSRDVFIVAG